ncbi:hypothetical protein K4K58_000955 [Colletotrichum sp. SAR11_239]|nr:hypothetical protein K4K58_000955 [Colletotrichum sp. SAR11_239]
MRPNPRKMLARGLSGALASRPRRSSGKPVPRPLPEPEVEEEEINPFARRGLRRSPPTGVIPQRSQPEPEPEPEPELPPTPTQRGQADPVVTTPPAGIHDTPSKRKRRPASPSKSSPLKQPPLRPPEFSQKTKDPSKKAPPTVTREKSPTPDPNAELEAERDALEAEIAKLEADLDFATEENERIRRVQSLRSATGSSVPASKREQLFDLLQRHLVPPQKDKKPDVADEWFDLAMNPTSWLSMASLGQTQPFTSKPQEEELPAPVSHHPIQMTAVEELPYLQAFTPFEFSGTTSILPRENEDEPLLRQHNIVVRSAHPAGLFMAKVEMTVDTEKLQINHLSVPRLDPAAVPELGPFIEKVANGGSNTHMRRNVSIITWAMAEWYRLAVERANVWHVLESELGDKENLVQSVAKIRTRRKKRRRKDDDDPSQDADSNLGDKDRAQNLTRGALLPHLGRTAFEIPIPDAVDEETSCLRIQWRIDFDWTGEAQRRLGDERGSLAAASKVFERLVQGNEGPMTAVRTVVALLAGDASS